MSIGGGPVILVVDDEPQITRVLRTTLSAQGYDIRVANDGEMALELMKNWTPHVVITDLAMPEQDGIETIRELRRVSPGAKIIAFSGAYGGQFLKVAKEIGADAVMHKPVSPEVLLGMVAEMLRQ